MLSSLPKPVRHRIYALALPWSRVEVEVTDDLTLLTKHCSLLQISKQIREDVLDACSDDTLELVHTIRSPSALISANAYGLSKDFKNIRLVLLAWLEDNNIAMFPDPDYLREKDAINGLTHGWRTAFRGLPKHVPLQMVYFDFINAWGAGVHQPARMLHIISVVLQSRSQGSARCKIIGCKTPDGQRYLENHTVGVIRARPDWKPKTLNAGKERDAGPSRGGQSRDYVPAGRQSLPVEGHRSPVLERSHL